MILEVILIGGLVGFSLCAGAMQKPNDVEVVAAVLIAEAGGEAVAGMEAVMEVIQNRCRVHGCVSLAQVCLKPGAFSCLIGTTPEKLIRRAKKHRKWRLAVGMAKMGVITKLAKGANHYHEASLDPKPAWADPAKITARIGNHIFYKL